MARGVKAGLFAMVDDGFITNFCLVPAQAFYDTEVAVCDILENIGQEITQLLKDKQDDIIALDFYGNHMPYDYLLWILYPLACKHFESLAHDKVYAGKRAGSRGKEFKIAGTFIMPDEDLVTQDEPLKQVGWRSTETSIESTRGTITLVNCFDHSPFPQGRRNGIVNADNIETIFTIIEHNHDEDRLKLSNDEAEHVMFLRYMGIVVKDGGDLKVTIPVISYEIEEQILHCINDMIAPLVEKYVDRIIKVADNHILPHIREGLFEEYVNSMLADFCNPLANVLYWAMYFGETLAMPRDYDMTGTALYLKK